jgi:hypothetical protein
MTVTQRVKLWVTCRLPLPSGSAVRPPRAGRERAAEITNTIPLHKCVRFLWRPTLCSTVLYGKENSIIEMNIANSLWKAFPTTTSHTARTHDTHLYTKVRATYVCQCVAGGSILHELRVSPLHHASAHTWVRNPRPRFSCEAGSADQMR